MRSGLRNGISPRRLATAGLAAACALLVFAALADAHDFWLVPNAFVIASGEQVQVHGQTSSRFPTSESAVALDRVADARVLGAEGSERIVELSHSGTSVVLRHRPTSAGQRVVAVALRARAVRESAASFRRYLELEGAPDALARIEREGLLRGRDSVTRRYAKYAKTVVEVGSGGPRAYTRMAEHALEFVSERDPAAFRAGDTAVIRLMYRGQPLPHAGVHAGMAPAPGGRVQLASASSEPDLHLTSDASGRLRLPLANGGLWNVRAIHVVQANPGSGADWDTHWATLVFYAGDGRAPYASSVAGAFGAQSDSGAVAAVIERYHVALATGDSATALALLADDAVILESGGVETREEYRSHHLPADIAFARAVKSERTATRVVVRGDVAWATSTSITQGEYRGRAINSAGAELIVLVRGTDGWRISAIHWSSRNRRS